MADEAYASRHVCNKDVYAKLELIAVDLATIKANFKNHVEEHEADVTRARYEANRSLVITGIVAGLVSALAGLMVRFVFG